MPKETKKKSSEKKKDPIVMMLECRSYDTKVFNSLMIFWLVQHSLPWN
jgi:hypothetical protein